MSDKTNHSATHLPPITDTALRVLMTIAVLVVAAWVGGSVPDWLIALIIGAIFGREVLVALAAAVATLAGGFQQERE